MNKAEREAKNSNATGNNTEEEVGVSQKESKDKLNAEAEQAEDDLKKELSSSCDVIEEKIAPIIKKVIPPPPPPAAIIAKAIDKRTEIEKAFDSATEAIIKNNNKEETMKQDAKDKLSNATNGTSGTEDSLIKKEIKEEK